MNHLPRFREPEQITPDLTGHEYTWHDEMELTVDGVTIAVLDLTVSGEWRGDEFVLDETLTVEAQHVPDTVPFGIPCLFQTGKTAAQMHMHGLKAALVDAVADHIRRKWTKIERDAFEDAQSKMEDA